MKSIKLSIYNDASLAYDQITKERKGKDKSNHPENPESYPIIHTGMSSAWNVREYQFHSSICEETIKIQGARKKRSQDGW